jgi:hypothetical protein
MMITVYHEGPKRHEAHEDTLYKTFFVPSRVFVSS